MYDNEYFVVDTAACTSTGEIINTISLALETLNNSGKKIVLKLNDTYLNQSQLLSIQSLITSWGCILDTIETVNPDTWTTAENMNIFVQKPLEKRLEEVSVDIKKEDEDEISENKDTDSFNDSISIKDVNSLSFEPNIDAAKEKAGIENTSVYSDYISSQINNKADEIDNLKDNLDQNYENKNLYSFKSNDIAEEPQEFEGDVKNSIGVYKKAYDTANTENAEWENVDFYESPTNEPVISDSKTTTYINQTLRSGQILQSDGNVVIIGDCHSGSEIHAVGDITVWGVLSGIAHAGCRGNQNAKIRALKMNAVQLRIANCYSRRPDATNIPYIIRSSVFTPEEARIKDNDIVLFKINQN